MELADDKKTRGYSCLVLGTGRERGRVGLYPGLFSANCLKGEQWSMVEKSEARREQKFCIMVGWRRATKHQPRWSVRFITIVQYLTAPTAMSGILPSCWDFNLNTGVSPGPHSVSSSASPVFYPYCCCSIGFVGLQKLPNNYSYLSGHGRGNLSLVRKMSSSLVQQMSNRLCLSVIRQ